MSPLSQAEEAAFEACRRRAVEDTAALVVASRPDVVTVYEAWVGGTVIDLYWQHEYARIAWLEARKLLLELGGRSGFDFHDPLGRILFRSGGMLLFACVHDLVHGGLHGLEPTRIDRPTGALPPEAEGVVRALAAKHGALVL